jgi:hypothetical protein
LWKDLLHNRKLSGELNAARPMGTPLSSMILFIPMQVLLKQAITIPTNLNYNSTSFKIRPK